MPNINVEVSEDELKVLNYNKGEKTWKDFLMDAARCYKKNQIISTSDGKFIVKGVTDLEMQNVGTDKQVEVPVKPNQIMVYTIYTLEKVE